MIRSVGEARPSGTQLVVFSDDETEVLEEELEKAAMLYRSPPPRDTQLNLDGISTCQEELAKGASQSRPTDLTANWPTSSTTAHRRLLPHPDA